MYVRYLIILVAIFFQKLPNVLSTNADLMKCSFQDSECLTVKARNLLKYIADGMPEIGIQKLDPLRMDTIKETVDNFTYEWSDIRLSGLRNSEIKNISVYADYRVMRVLYQTTILMEFHHVANGIAISNIYIEGDGEAAITFENMQIEIIFGYDIVKGANGKNFLKVNNYLYGLSSIDNVHYSFGNTYKGNKEQGEMLHQFLNDTWRAIVANFGQNVHIKMTDKPAEAVKAYLSSYALEDLGLY